MSRIYNKITQHLMPCLVMDISFSVFLFYKYFSTLWHFESLIVAVIETFGFSWIWVIGAYSPATMVFGTRFKRIESCIGD
jgi:hypothetical protein